MTNEKYIVTRYQPLQVAPCIGSGLRAVFRDSGEATHVSPVAAMAVCSVRRDWYWNGRFVARESVEREVCGILAYAEEGFGICEENSNFLGYLQPGQDWVESAE